MASSAPLAATQTRSPSSCMVVIRRREASNVSSSTRGSAARNSGAKTPRLPAKARRAPSVGSPLIDHWPPTRLGAWSTASLQAAATQATLSSASSRPRSMASPGALSSSANVPSGAYPSPLTTTVPAGVQTRSTDILFSVSVPVLSVQITDTDPSVSTAGSLRTRALRRAIRRAPKARAMVTTAGRPSGIAATARLTATRNISSGEPPRATPDANTATHTTPARRAIALPSLLNWSWSGVAPSRCSSIKPATRPRAVSMPVAKTIAVALP